MLLKRAYDLLRGAANDLIVLGGLVITSAGVEFGHPGLIVFGIGLVGAVALGARR